MARFPFHDDAPFFTALEAAAHLLHIACQRHGSLTHEQLQYLLYCAQGFTLFSLGKPLFADPIEAEADGPRIRSVEREYASFGNAAIPIADDLQLNDSSVLAAAVIYATHLEYQGLSSVELARLVCQEGPMLEARAHGRVIRPASMAEYWQDWQRDQQRVEPAAKPVALSSFLKSRPDVAAMFDPQRVVSGSPRLR